jgi:RimJ/RimL family protein N-acetyltransferase
MLIGTPPVELPQPPLERGPLALREWEEGDAKSLVEACAEDASRMFGAVGLHAVSLTRRRAEIGYWTAPWARSQGVAQAALELLSDWALGPLGLERLDLYVEPENETSQRVAERAGYKRGALVRSGIALRGRRYDMLRFTRLR